MTAPPASPIGDRGVHRATAVKSAESAALRHLAPEPVAPATTSPLPAAGRPGYNDWLATTTAGAYRASHMSVGRLAPTTCQNVCHAWKRHDQRHPAQLSRR